MRTHEQEPIRLYTKREAAETLRVSQQTIWRLIHIGQLKGFHVGSQWRFTREQILAALTPPDECKVQSEKCEVRTAPREFVARASPGALRAVAMGLAK